MSNTFPPSSFEIIETADKSPTLSLNGGEKMHSMEGALSETLYIYSPCIEAAFKLGEPRILSMGLGLGYNEILSFAWAAQNSSAAPTIHSFEIIPELKSYFLKWLEGKESPLHHCYESILTLISDHFDLKAEKVKEIGQTLFASRKLVVSKEISFPNTSGMTFNSILFDAFSAQTNPDLWTSHFFENFISEYCDNKTCFFSTYAATGNLKRSLISKGFSFQKKKGFGRKRECTFAYKSSSI